MRKSKNEEQVRQIATRIREIRKCTGLTQEKFAEILDISISAYKKLESGDNQVSIDCLRNIKSKLNVSSDYILYGKHEDAEAVWRQVLNCSSMDKALILARLFNYFVKVKEEKYITVKEQTEYDEQLMDIIKALEDKKNT